MSGFLEKLINIAVPVEANGPLAVLAPANNFSLSAIKQHSLAHAHFATRMHQRSPSLRIVTHGLQ